MTAGHESKPARGRVGFGPRLAAAMSALILATCTILSVVIVQGAMNQALQLLFLHTGRIAEQIARDSELAMMSGDDARLLQLARTAVAQRDVKYCGFVDRGGRVRAAFGARIQPSSANRPPLDRLEGPIEIEPSVWEFRVPIVTHAARPQREELGFEVAPGEGGSEHLGTVLLGVTGGHLDDLRGRILVAAGSVTVVVALFSVIVAMALAQRMSGPLRELADAADKVARGDLGIRVDSANTTEIGAVADAFNTMVESLRRSRRQLEDSSRNLEATVRNRTESLEAANRELETANRLKSEFLATVSHELRTPLHVILGYAAMIEEGGIGAVTAQQRELLTAIQRYSKMQLDLLTDVLDFSRLQSGRISYHIEEFDLGELLRDVANLYRSRLEGSGVTIEVQLPSPSPRLTSDRVKIQEIVRNLVDNAAKFTQRGKIVIEAATRAGGERVLIRVRDTGIGIAEEELPHIFEAFRQVGESSTRHSGGVGLGLSIVQQLCHGLAGACSAESQPGQGSTFVIDLPRRFTPPTAAA